MNAILGALRTVGRGLRHLVSLVREGQDDLRGTYPDQPGPSPEQAATTMGINMGGFGPGGHA